MRRSFKSTLSASFVAFGSFMKLSKYCISRFTSTVSSLVPFLATRLPFRTSLDGEYCIMVPTQSHPWCSAPTYVNETRDFNDKTTATLTLTLNPPVYHHWSEAGGGLSAQVYSWSTLKWRQRSSLFPEISNFSTPGAGGDNM